MRYIKGLSERRLTLFARTAGLALSVANTELSGADTNPLKMTDPTQLIAFPFGKA